MYKNCYDLIFNNLMNQMTENSSYENNLMCAFKNLKLIFLTALTIYKQSQMYST